MGRRKPRRATQPDTTRRASAAHLAQGQPLPPAMVQSPHLFMGGQRPVPAQSDKGEPRLGIPAEKILQSMYANQAPQAGFGGVLAPGAPIRPIPGVETYDGPRQWEFPTGVNVSIAPRSTERYSFSQLRRLAYLYYGIQMAEGVWFDVLARLVPKITMRPGVIPDGESDDDPQWAKVLQPARDFFRRPDGQQSLSSWITASVRDMLELGLSLIWKRRDMAGRLIGLDVIDPAMWKILVDQRGRFPQPPYPAYLQVVNGLPAGLYTTENLIQIQEHGRSDSIYPLARVEKILFTVQQALRHQDLNYARYTDGSVPEGMLFVDDAGGTGDPLDPKWEMVERALNGQLAGNDTMRSRIKIIPPGLKDWKETRPDDPKVDYDRWLLNLVAGMFGVTLDELGITDTSNRSVGASQENVIYRRVVRPVAATYAAVLTEVAQELCDDPRVLVEWVGIDEPEDELKKAQVLEIGVKNMAISPSDMAHLMKWTVTEEVAPFMATQSGLAGIVTPEMVAKATAFVLANQQTDQETKAAALQQQQLINQQMQRQQAQSQEPDFGDGGEESAEGDTENGGESPENAPPAPNGAAASPTEAEQREDAADVDRLIQQAQTRARVTQPDATRNEWRAWREKALRAAKAGHPQPIWQPDALPAPHTRYTQEHLQGVVTPDAVRAVFAAVRDAEGHPALCRCMVCGCGLPHTDHNMPYPTLPAGVTENHGVMIAFLLPYQVANQIAVPGGVAVRDLHCTLAYLGDAAACTSDQDARLQETVQAFARAEAPLTATLSGIGRFTGQEGDTGDPLYASLDSPDLAGFRQRLCQALDAAGLDYATAHGFTPHVTLAWLPPDAPTPDLRVDALPVTFGHLWCCIGDRRYCYALGHPDTADRAALAVEVARSLKAELLAGLEY